LFGALQSGDSFMASLTPKRVLREPDWTRKGRRHRTWQQLAICAGPSRQELMHRLNRGPAKTADWVFL